MRSTPDSSGILTNEWIGKIRYSERICRCLVLGVVISLFLSLFFIPLIFSYHFHLELVHSAEIKLYIAPKFFFTKRNWWDEWNCSTEKWSICIRCDRIWGRLGGNGQYLLYRNVLKMDYLEKMRMHRTERIKINGKMRIGWRTMLNSTKSEFRTLLSLRLVHAHYTI